MIIFIWVCALIVFALTICIFLPDFLNGLNTGFYFTIIFLFSMAIFILLIRKRAAFFKTLSHYVCGFLIIFILSELGLIYFSSNQPHKSGEQAIIVCGSDLFVESRLSSELESQLDLAVEIYKSNNTLPIILSGGVDENRALPQCVAMKEYIENKTSEQQLTPPVIITEDSGTTIKENIDFSLEKSGVSSAYIIVARHSVPRTKLIAHKHSPLSTIIGADYPYSKYILYYIREFGYMLKTIILDGII